MEREMNHERPEVVEGIASNGDVLLSQKVNVAVVAGALTLDLFDIL